LLLLTQVLDEEIACLVHPSPAAMADGIVGLAENKVLREKIWISGKATGAGGVFTASLPEEIGGILRTVARLIGLSCMCDT